MSLAFVPAPRPRTVDPDAPYADWCRRIRLGDASAFEALFRDLHPGLVRFAGGFAESTAAADDLVQEAFVRIWERRQRLDPERSLRALLFQTVRNLGLNRARDRATRREKLDGLAAEAAMASGGGLAPDALAEAEATRARLHAWMEELPERQREALHLTRVQGLSHEEAARVMGVSPRTVNNHLVRALRTLRDRLQRIDPTTP